MNSQTRIVTSAADGCGNPSSIRSMDNSPSRDHKGAEYKESFMFSNRSSVSRGNTLAATALAVAGLVGLVGLAGPTAASTVSYWTGAISSDPAVGGNWSSTVPSVPGTNGSSGNYANITINTSSPNPLNYANSDGETSFNGQLTISNGGILNISGGTLTDNSATLPGNSGYALVGQTSPGTINVSGGNLNITAGQIILGNWTTYPNNTNTTAGTTAAGVINLSGGIITADTTSGLIVGNAGNAPGPGIGAITITGGVFDLSGGSITVGMVSGAAVGNGTLTFGLGSGLLEQTASSTLTIGTGSMINFLSGSRGELSLNQITSRTYFDSLVTSGQIKLNGGAATPSDFAFTTTGTGTTEQGIYTLIPVPEPATLGLTGIGAIGLLLLKRRKVV